MKIKQIVKELALLLPAYSFLSNALKKSDNTNDNKENDFILAEDIVKQIWVRILPYKKLHKEAADLWNKCEEKVGYSSHNVFLLGLSLVAKHLERKNNQIRFSYSKKLVELQDLSFNFFENNEINKSADFVDEIVLCMDL
jgi:hypothetical protein